jgi:hypothetical protein
VLRPLQWSTADVGRVDTYATDNNEKTKSGCAFVAATQHAGYGGRARVVTIVARCMPKVQRWPERAHAYGEHSRACARVP